jgi:hypothetical protein
VSVFSAAVAAAAAAAAGGGEVGLKTGRWSRVQRW